MNTRPYDERGPRPAPLDLTAPDHADAATTAQYTRAAKIRGPMPCPACDGTGTGTDLHWCIPCWGTGSRSARDLYALTVGLLTLCATCTGHGRIGPRSLNRGQRCTTCSGRGVHLPDRVSHPLAGAATGIDLRETHTYYLPD